MILPLPIDNALICFGPGTQVIITSENLINASNEFVAFPFLDLNCFKDLGLTTKMKDAVYTAATVSLLWCFNG